MSIHAIGALLLISDRPRELAAFYRDALGLPIEDEQHDDIALHYGCEIGGTHFAIHPSPDWPGEPAPNTQSPVIVLHTDDVIAAYNRLVAHGVNATPPFDHGFAILTAFRDPDGHNVQVMRLAS
ncbi:MAG: VOC family protein [Acidimicrobiales bacterium]